MLFSATLPVYWALGLGGLEAWRLGGLGLWGIGYIYNMLIIWQSYTAHIRVNDERKRIN